MNNYPIPSSIEDSLKPNSVISVEKSWTYQSPSIFRVPDRPSLSPPINCKWKILLINNESKDKEITLNFTDTIKNEGWQNFCESLIMRQLILIQRIRVRVNEKENLHNQIHFIQKDGYGSRRDLMVCPHDYITPYSEYQFQDNAIDIDYDLNASPGFGIQTLVASKSVTEIVLFA